MQAGKLRHRVVVETNTRTQDAQGQPVASWATAATVWASIEPLSGAERLQGAEVESTVTHRITMRYLENSTAFVAADVDTGDDHITSAAHGLATGQAVRITTDDTIPTGLVAGTTYYAIKVDANDFRLAATYALAVAGTDIDITAQGVGTHTYWYGVLNPRQRLTHGGRTFEIVSVTNFEERDRMLEVMCREAA